MAFMFTVKKSAEILGISLSKMYEVVQKRRISHYRIEGKIMLDEADLQAYLKTCRIEAGGKSATRSTGVFKHLNPTRLAEAWRKRGVSPSPLPPEGADAR
jgi:excisionase family DNA binding protein